MKAYNGSTILGEVLTCKRQYESAKVANKALDGTQYLQTTGVAAETRAIALYCDTYARRCAMDNASNNGALISVEDRDGLLKGYVKEDVSWREFPDGHGVGIFELTVKEVVVT